MAKLTKLTRAAIKALPLGGEIREHGIIARRTATGDVSYSVNVMVDGQRIHRSIGTEGAGVTREQAERAIETLKTRAREDRLNLPKARKRPMLLREAGAAYLDRLEAEGGKGIPRKAQHLRDRLNPYLGSSRLDGVTSGEAARFAKARHGEGAEPSTVNRELATLSHLLRAAARWGWISKDQVPEIKKLREGRGRLTVLSPEECHNLLRGAVDDQDPDLWLFVQICLQTSMRHGEARKLRWEHYDSHRRRFFIPEAKAGERDQPIPSDLAVKLDQVRASRAADAGYIFAGGPGSTTGYRHTFRKAFARAAVRAGLDPSVVTPHVLRHTAITKLVKAGVDLPTIQKVSGHKTLAMVLRYSHVDGTHIDQAIDHLRL